MSMPWFKMYSEMIDDPTVGRLDDAAHRLWVELLCIACEAGGEDTEKDARDIAWRLRRNDDATLHATLKKLQCNGLISLNATGTFIINGWEGRQDSGSKAKSSTERSKKRRARLKAEKIAKSKLLADIEDSNYSNNDNPITECNESATLHATECNDIDKIRVDKIRVDEIRDRGECNGEEVAITSPKKPKKSKPRFKKPTLEELTEYFNQIDLPDPEEPGKFLDYHDSRGWVVSKNPMQDWKAAARYWKRNWLKFTGGGNAKLKSDSEKSTGQGYLETQAKLDEIFGTDETDTRGDATEIEIN